MNEEQPHDELLLRQIPQEVLQAERTLSRWFAERNIREWALGDCQSRTVDAALHVTIPETISPLAGDGKRNDSDCVKAARIADMAVDTPNLPPLPKSDFTDNGDVFGAEPTPGYTALQMQEYALAALRARGVQPAQAQSLPLGWRVEVREASGAGEVQLRLIGPGDSVTFGAQPQSVRAIFFREFAEAVAAAGVKEPSADKLLGDLLARIHRDGGHYVMEHGWQKAAEDAETKVLTDRLALALACFDDEGKVAFYVSEAAAAILADDSGVDSVDGGKTE